MKRYLIILALCGSAYAGDYRDKLQDQLDRIEQQQEEILRHQRQVETDASLAKARAEIEASAQRSAKYYESLANQLFEREVFFEQQAELEADKQVSEELRRKAAEFKKSRLSIYEAWSTSARMYSAALAN